MKVGMVAAALTLAFGVTVAGMAQAKNTPTLAGCATDQPSGVGATIGLCEGWYNGNLNNTANLTFDESILSSDYGKFNISVTKFPGNLQVDHSDSITFAQALTGISILSVHVGGGSGIGGEGTAFFEVTAPKGGLSTLNFGKGASDVTVWATGLTAPVPEAAGWAFAIAGVGAIGFAARRRRAASALAA